MSVKVIVMKTFPIFILSRFITHFPKHPQLGFGNWKVEKLTSLTFFFFLS